MTLSLITPPTADPVTLAEVKNHLRITHTDEDTLITEYLLAAVAVVEHRGQIAMLTQTWRLTFDCLPRDVVELPRAPVTAIATVTVKDTDGVRQSVDPSAYEFAPGTTGRLRPIAAWPAPGIQTGGVEIDFTAGYGAAADVPADLKQAVKLIAAHFYEARENVSEASLKLVPQAADALIAPYRRVAL